MFGRLFRESPPPLPPPAWYEPYEVQLGCPIWSLLLFAALVAVYLALQLAQRLATPADAPPAAVGDAAQSGSGVKGAGSGVSLAQREAEFAAFKWRWGLAYTTIILADWLQGTHMYALYASYGLDKDAIANLFLTGFASGALCSTFIGPLIDRRGRKAGCVLYCVLEIVINLLEHFPSMRLLLVGRALGGLSTSLLFSAFEAWLVTEHKQRGFPDAWLERVFSLNGAISGISAILAGLCAQLLTVNLGLGNIGPFKGAIVLTALALAQILPWPENHGDTTAEVGASTRLALRTMAAQPSLLLLGVVQSLFEGAMYTFVFNWVPVLEGLAPPSAQPFPHGLVFACFMLCIASGSAAFEFAGAQGIDARHGLAATLVLATAGLATPVAINSFPVVMGAFCVFEACCGAFGPACATLRSRVIPGHLFSTILNLYRITLNMAVVAGTKGSTYASSSALFATCAAALALATGCQLILNNDPRVRRGASPDALGEAKRD